MMTSANPITTAHILQTFDGELEQLHELVLKMTNLILYQLELALTALSDEDCETALKIIAQDKHVNHLAIEIDKEVLEVLARHNPVANDLRTVISISKISNELEKINDEITEIARLILALFEPRLGAINSGLPVDLINIGNLIEIMLKKLILAFWNRQSTQAYALLELGRGCEQDLQISTKQQLALAVSDARKVGRSLDIMEILKALEHCGESCRNIAEYIIFMIDGEDIRHLKLNNRDN